MKVTFLGHSGFAVDTGCHVLLFDYCPRRMKRITDPILHTLLDGRSPLVFVSHVHGDHYDPDIYELNGARFWVGTGVPDQKDAVVMVGGDTFQDEALTVTAYPSTDEGVAFLVEIDGLTVYHAGDLNWWYWPDEPDPWNPQMAQTFLSVTEPLLKQEIDLAFLCADPRQREGWLFGFDHLMRNGRIRRAVPMHFWNQKSAPSKVCAAPITEHYRDRIVPLSQLGDSVSL